MIQLLSRRLAQIPGQVYLLAAVTIFAAANSVTRRLNDIGAQHLIEGRNPISFCNVLFVGNLVALMALLGLYWQELSPRQWQSVTVQSWLTLVLIAVLSGALAPALFFMALDVTSVNNVVLISRIEPPLTLTLSVWLLRERTNRWVVAGAVVSFIGVVLALTLQRSGGTTGLMATSSTGQGEVMALAGAATAAIATVVSKGSLVLQL